MTLKAAQIAAAEAGCLLPLSIASEGSAQIGGVLATNAGGNNTVRYGNARDLVLGLEVVLPDGTVWNGLRRLRKDNTGYCLRQLFVGSEGTLGIITAAVLKLVPQPREVCVALCAVASPEAALRSVRPLPVARSGGDQRLRTDVGARHRVRAAAHRRCGAAACVRRAALRAGGAGHAAPRCRPARVAGDGAGAGAGRRHRGGCGDRRERGAARGDLAAARGALRGAEARRRQREERRLGAGVEGAGVHPPRDRRVRGADARHPRRAVRPHGRRQHPLQSGAAGRTPIPRGSWRRITRSWTR